MHYSIYKAIVLLISVTVASFACTKVQPARTLILSYADFGPQVIAHKLIGNEWYQWDSHGDSDPKTSYNVKVVVYRDIPLEKIKEMYPVIKGKQDYRYVEYDAAIKFLTEYENDPDLEQLRETKSKIIEKLSN